MTIYEALATATKAVPPHEAKLLLAHCMGLTATDLLIKNHQPLDETAKGAFFAAIERRIANEPLQYILGEWEFMGLKMKTDSRALIPRPETELLVEEALRYIGRPYANDISSPSRGATPGHGKRISFVTSARGRCDFIHGSGREDPAPTVCRAVDSGLSSTVLSPDSSSTPIRVLDVCTGSGCIAIAIAKLSGASVTATDISQKALSLAKENAELHGLTNKINFIQSDLLNNLNNQVFDIIISNPPYIPTTELSTLQPELAHEPTLALDGGQDGLDPYRKLIPQALASLTPGGTLLLEIGPPTVEAIMKDSGYGMIRTINDYGGLPRIVTGTRMH